jgi:hypothetical protein
MRRRTQGEEVANAFITCNGGSEPRGVHQLAADLGVSAGTVRRWCKTGLLPPPKVVGRRWVWPAGTKAVPASWLAPSIKPRLRLAWLERRGAKLSLLQARVFDIILESGEAGVSTAELHHEVYGRHSRPRRPDAIVQVIRDINLRLAGTPCRLVSRPGRFARWRVQQAEGVLTSVTLDRGGRKMTVGARQRYYEGLPRDVAKQEQLERENRQLREENKALRSVVSTAHRLVAPYAAKAEPISRMLTKSFTSNK